MRTTFRFVGLACAVTLLASGCVTRASELSPATTTSRSPTSTAAPLTEVPADPAIGDEVADLLATADADGFNDRICPGTNDLEPVSAIGREYAGTTVLGFGEAFHPNRGDEKVAVLAVRSDATLVISLGVDFNMNDWCVYTVDWCPPGFPGLPPFPVRPDNEVAREILCRTLPPAGT
jgi:hypothetical protein